MYQIGILTNPKGDDVVVGNYVEAITIAERLARSDANVPVAVWYDDDVVRLFLNEEIFKLVE